MPVPLSRNQARVVAKVCRARVREINTALERTSLRVPRTALLKERGQLLELVRLFEAHGDLPPSSEPFGELGATELTVVARACRTMIRHERDEEEKLRERMPSYRGGCSETLERLAAYFQRKADEAV